MSNLGQVARKEERNGKGGRSNERYHSGKARLKKSVEKTLKQRNIWMISG